MICSWSRWPRPGRCAARRSSARTACRCRRSGPTLRCARACRSPRQQARRGSGSGRWRARCPPGGGGPHTAASRQRGERGGPDGSRQAGGAGGAAAARLPGSIQGRGAADAPRTRQRGDPSRPRQAAAGRSRSVRGARTDGPATAVRQDDRRTAALSGGDPAERALGQRRAAARGPAVQSGDVGFALVAPLVAALVSATTPVRARDRPAPAPRAWVATRTCARSRRPALT